MFLTPLVILTLIHLSLYAKYKSGNYIAMKTVEEDRFMHQPLTHITHVSVYGLNNFKLAPSDSSRLEIEKMEENHLHYFIQGDSLVIHGDSMVSRPGQPVNIERSYQAVNVFLPASAIIVANNSELRIAGSNDSLKARSYQVYLTGSASFKIEENGDDSSHQYFKELAIAADHSSGIELTANTSLLSLQLNLVESYFTDNGALINKLSVAADKASTITLKGNNLQKINTAHQ